MYINRILWIITELLLIYPSSFVFSKTTYCSRAVTGTYKSCESGIWTLFGKHDSIIKTYPDKIEITNKKVNVFQNKALENILSSSSIKYLQLNLADVKLHIEPLAFSNLPALENLEINSASVLLDTDIFYGLNNLKYLKFQLANETKSYLNDLLDNHPILHKLGFVNHQDVDICDFTRQNTSLNIFELQYTGGPMTVVTRQSFYCLKNLQQLTIRESNLTLISSGAFNVLEKLKKVSIVSNNKLTHISTNVFNTVRSLEVIDLSNNSINEIDNGALTIEDGKLALLNLSYNLLEIIKEGTFKNIKCNVIDLTQSQIVAIADGAFSFANVLRIYLFDNYLSTIDISNWGINDDVIIYIQYINTDIATNHDDELVSSIDHHHNDDICYFSEYYYFKICKTSTMQLKLVEHLFDNWQPETLEITDDNISSIKENAFLNINIKVLTINSAAKSFTLLPASFAGFKDLKVLKLNTKPIRIESYIFDNVISLKFLEISVDESSNIFLCQLFTNLIFFDSLYLTHQNKIDICDKKICIQNNNSFNISTLHYENGKIPNIQKLAFSCLKKLKNLVVTNCNLSTVDPHAFDGLDNIKYISLSSNKIKTIDNKLFMNKNLLMLDLSDNLLTHIKKDTFIGVRTGVLDISNNEIVEIDNGAFKDMNLNHLYYYNNNDGVFVNSRYWNIDDSQIEVNCETQKTYRICIKGETLSSVDIPNKYSFSRSSLTSFVGWLITSDTLEIFDERISAMRKYVFKDLLFTNYPKTLNIHKNIKSKFIIHPESFEGLLNLENLILDVGPIEVKENLFDRLISLNYLKIEIKKNPKLPSKYINNVLKTVPSLRVLEILNSDSINICDNPISNENLLPITGLYYTGGLISTLPKKSLQCLRNLEKLSLSETQLATIEVAVFDSLNNLKYIHLASNEITCILSGIFDSVNNLIILDLNHNKINVIDNKSLMKSGNNNLQLVNLSYNEISIIKIDIFKGFKCSQLDLSHNKISHIEGDAFKDTNIHDIFLFNNNIILPIKEIWKIPSFTFVHVKKPSCFISFCSGKRTRICDHPGLCESRCIDYISSPPGVG